MELLLLNSTDFYSALLQAAYRLIEQREAINAINVFPVADGDTGDNMAATAMAIIQNSRPEAGFDKTCQAVANAALLGARGNSGMIFSQFFNGLADAAPAQDSLSTVEFANLIQAAGQSVRAAISTPVEGTILTVMEVWVKAIGQFAPTMPCFKALLSHCQPLADAAVQQTTKQLDILSQAQVVDAGALGFYYFISGFTDQIHSPQALPEQPDFSQLSHAHHELPAMDSPPNHRYCTEGMITGSRINKEQLGQLLQTFGDSVVISGHQQACRFHLHCNAPTDVFTAVKDLGLISQPKVDDMQRQYEMVHSKRHHIGLVADSNADLSQALIDQFQVHLLPLNMHLDGHHFLNRYGLDANHFYDLLSQLKTYPTTSFPSPALIEQKLAAIAPHYDKLLVISIAKILSGTYEAISQAAANHPNITVIDSKQVAGAEGLLVYYAAQLIDQGYSFPDIVESVLKKRQSIKLFVLVDRFDSMIRSGRISKLGGTVASFLKIKPILTLNEEGKAVIKDKVFNYDKGLQRLIQLAKDFIGDRRLQAYGLIHAGIPEQAGDFSQLCHSQLGQQPLFIEPVSTAIGLHAGRGCMAIAVMVE